MEFHSISLFLDTWYFFVIWKIEILEYKEENFLLGKMI